MYERREAHTKKTRTNCHTDEIHETKLIFLVVVSALRFQNAKYIPLVRFYAPVMAFLSVIFKYSSEQQ